MLFVLGFNRKLDMELFSYFQYINRNIARFYTLGRNLDGPNS